MPKTEKKPEVTLSVGAFYYALNNPGEGMDFDASSYDNIVKSPVIKKVGMKETGESTPVKASGINYMTVSSKSDEELTVEVVAFAPDDLAKFRGDTVSESGLITDSVAPVKPFFACGFPIEKSNGQSEYRWYPKCQLVENTGDVETKEDSFKEQNKTLTIKAYAFNDKSIKTSVDTELSSFPAGLTEEAFFSKVITSDADLASVIPEGA